MSETMKAVEMLVEGDLVDLAGDIYADPDNSPELDSEYQTVGSVEQETPECVAVSFEGFDLVGFPTGHMVKVFVEDEA